MQGYNIINVKGLQNLIPVVTGCSPTENNLSIWKIYERN